MHSVSDEGDTATSGVRHVLRASVSPSLRRAINSDACRGAFAEDTSLPHSGVTFDMHRGVYTPTSEISSNSDTATRRMRTWEDTLASRRLRLRDLDKKKMDEPRDTHRCRRT